jgi:uncharacterized small protein (TIGR04563 family)
MAEPDKVKRSYALPAGVIEDMQEAAIGSDRSLSYVVQAAWQQASGQIASAASLDELGSGTGTDPDNMSSQTLFVPVQMDEEIEKKAEEFGCPPARLIEAAWKLSRK